MTQPLKVGIQGKGVERESSEFKVTIKKWVEVSTENHNLALTQLQHHLGLKETVRWWSIPMVLKIPFPLSNLWVLANDAMVNLPPYCYQ